MNSAKTEILRTRTAISAAALDPHKNVVVEACAGSGKTWLLVARVLRLLLAGAPPSSILAITFTRKGAAEMKSRLMRLLEELAGATDEEARRLLRERAVGEAEIEALLPKAKALFAEVAFASPGVTISTFHGWFQQILAAAPLGFGIGDSVIADSETRLLEEAWQSFAENLNRAPDSAAGQSLHRLFEQRGLSNTKSLLYGFLACRVDWQLYARESLGLPADTPVEEVTEAAAERWAGEWGIDPSHDPIEDWFANAKNLADCRALFTGLTKLEKLPKTARERMDSLERALTADTAEAAYQLAYRAFLTKEDTPVKVVESWADKAGFATEHRQLCMGLQYVREALQALRNLELNRDALTAGLGLLAAYEKLKSDQRQLDYNDLEWRAFDLLADSVHAETLQYRLDCRYRHLLLDEFQDTSPIQWRCLTEWLNASAAADNRPSVFLVGDPKQAIYRFRRTDARLFEIARKYFQNEYGAIDCRLDSTRRNAPAVIDFVNALFTDLPDYPGFHRHESEQQGLSGAAHVLAAQEAPEVEEAKAIAWRNPLQAPLAEDDAERYAAEAAAMADSIARIVGQQVIEERGADGRMVKRAAQYGDVLVLFRRRSPLPTFEDALRHAGIPYLSARSGGLIETLEVQDLVALLRFLSAPADDLALAQVLKSPLFSASDRDLLTIRFAPGEALHENSWWQRLQTLEAGAHLPPTSPLARARHHLARWFTWMDTLPVHDLLDRIFHDADVAARYMASVPAPMRASVAANLRAFMALALQLDGGRYPSLPRFLDELKRYRALPDEDAPDLGEVRAEQKAERPDAVRMMTIHMAKGLEAPIVWLIDSADGSSRNEHHFALVDWRPEEPAPRHFSFVADKESRDPARQPIFEEEADYQARERKNLLYVAATRAKQYFVMSGTRPSKSGPPSWLEWAGERWEENSGHTDAPWPELSAQAAAERARDHGSQNGGEGGEPWPISVGTRHAPDLDMAARSHGIQVHAALEALAPVGKGADARAPDGIAEGAIRSEALRIMASPGLARFFAPAQFTQAGNEVEIAHPEGTVRIDRLVWFESEIWVLDYKTGEADVTRYRSQVEGYCRLVAELYPALRVRGALVAGDGALVEVL